MHTFDYIIVGMGIMGLMTAYELDKSGLNGLCLEQFEIGHQKGSSHGQTRAFHYGYYNDELYLKKIKQSEKIWLELENKSGLDILQRVGKLEIHDKESIDYARIDRFAKKFNIKLNHFNNKELKRQFPYFNFNDQQIGLYEPEAGYLFIDHIYKAVMQSFSSSLQLKEHEQLMDWQKKDDYIKVITNKHVYRCKHLYLTTGSWYQTLKQPIALTRVQKQLCWFSVEESWQEVYEKMPIFGFKRGDDFFYGFPPLYDQIKIARHTGGDQIIKSKDILTRVNEEELQEIVKFVKKNMKGIASDLPITKSCIYTNTETKESIIERHKLYHNVYYAVGFNGEGFKVAPSIATDLIGLSL